MFGLPLHPLVVHAAVVFIPLAALAVLALVFVPRWRERYGVLGLGVVAIAAVAAVAARFTGEMLAETVPNEPWTHERWGNIAMIGALVLAGVTAVWWILQRRNAKSPLAVGAGLVASLAAIVSLVLVTLAGHSGASATWGASASAEPTSAASSTASYTMAEVATHSTPECCGVAKVPTS